jgi:tetratricopeptide (TPR) repeat protein
VFEAKGLFAEAAADYTRALRLNATFAEAVYNRGLLHIKTGDTVKGCQDLAKACELGLCEAKNRAADTVGGCQ